MLSLRNRFGIPGVISVLALVFALVAGGAYAAENSGDDASASAKKNNRAKQNRKNNSGLNGKQKRQVRNIAANIAKRFQGTGPAGPQGVPGLPGAPGEDGDDGSDGSNGSNGSNGESVTLAAATGCAEGGTKLSVGGDSEEVCNGEEGPEGDPGPEGSPWTDMGVLPPDETLTGAWAPNGIGEAFPKIDEGTTFVPVSFPIPLESAPSVVMVKGNEDKSGEGCPNEVNNDGHLVGGVPEADPGTFCVYVTVNAAFTGSLAVSGLNPTRSQAPGAVDNTGAAVSGVQLKLDCSAGIGCIAGGSWAVTG